MCLETSTSPRRLDGTRMLAWGWLLCTVHQCQKCCLHCIIMPNSAQWLEYSAPENTYLLISILLEIFQLFQKISGFLSSLPQAAWLHLLRALLDGSEKPQNLWQNAQVPFPWGRSKVISDWEFHILKPQDNRRLKLG